MMTLLHIALVADGVAVLGFWVFIGALIIRTVRSDKSGKRGSRPLAP